MLDIALFKKAVETIGKLPVIKMNKNETVILSQKN